MTTAAVLPSTEFWSFGLILLVLLLCYKNMIEGLKNVCNYEQV